MESPVKQQMTVELEAEVCSNILSGGYSKQKTITILVSTFLLLIAILVLCIGSIYFFITVMSTDASALSRRKHGCLSAVSLCLCSVTAYYCTCH